MTANLDASSLEDVGADSWIAVEDEMSVALSREFSHTLHDVTGEDFAAAMGQEDDTVAPNGESQSGEACDEDGDDAEGDLDDTNDESQEKEDDVLLAIVGRRLAVAKSSGGAGSGGVSPALRTSTAAVRGMVNRPNATNRNKGIHCTRNRKVRGAYDEDDLDASDSSASDREDASDEDGGDGSDRSHDATRSPRQTVVPAAQPVLRSAAVYRYYCRFQASASTTQGIDDNSDALHRDVASALKWCSRRMLERRGWKAVADAYDAAHPAIAPRAGALAPADTDECPPNERPVNGCYNRFLYTGPVPTPLEGSDPLAALEHLLGGPEALLMRVLARAADHCTVTGMWRLPCRTRMRRFVELARELRGRGWFPVLLFHGTKAHRLASVARHGLVMPGTRIEAPPKHAAGPSSNEDPEAPRAQPKRRGGDDDNCATTSPRPTVPIRVVNGSAYGVGVYTARSIGTPLRYSTTEASPTSSKYLQSAFVCCGLVQSVAESPALGGRAASAAKNELGRQTMVKVAGRGQFFVFFDDAYVIPLWLLRASQFVPRNSAPHPIQIAKSLENLFPELASLNGNNK